MAMPKFDDVFDVAQKSGQFEDKTFLAFFGAWKHKQTREPLQFFYKYLQCSVEDGIKLFDSQDFTALAKLGGKQSHMHLTARYVESGAWVGVQLEYTGAPDFGMKPVPALILEGDAGKRMVQIFKAWQGE